MNLPIRLTIASAALLLGAAAQAATLNVGCFNIRFQTPSDQGDLDWNNRKEYVARTITDTGYDIVGINEMRADQQRLDMLELLPGYTFSGWGTESATSQYEGTFNAVLFRTDKFELLDEGHFFLAKSTLKPQISWDCSNNKRMTVWAKLKVKESGEIIYYFLTHLDHQGSDARNEGARINLEKIREITGHYPCIITGDHNSSAIRYPFYDLFTAYMDDARKVTATPFPWDKDGTLCKWNPETKDGTRLDYIWVRGAKVNTYRHINETYGRPVTPSDHFPIVANITLEPYKADHTRYVDASATSGGDGSLAAPFNRLQDAIDATCTGDTIYVTAGDYAVTESAGLRGKEATIDISHSLTILGGYDSDFREVTGLSRIDGKGEVYRVITVRKPAALELSNFEICGGNATDNLSATTGAGICALGARLELDRVTIRDNHAKGNGGGVYASGQLVCRNCRFERNISDGNGGGFYTNYSGEKLWWRYGIIGCYFAENEALQGSAGFHGGFSWSFIGHNTFADNRARHSGTISLNGATFDSRASLVNNTFYNNRVDANPGAINEIKGGAAILAKLSPESQVALVNNTIVANHTTCGDESSVPADFHGAAVNIYSGKLTLYGNLIGANTTNSGGCADIVTDGGEATSRFNLFTCAGAIDFTKHRDDIVAKNYEAALPQLAELFEGAEVADGLLVVKPANEGHVFPVLRTVHNVYNGKEIDVIPYAMYNENMLNADVDFNIELNDKLIYDQRGQKKSVTGAGCMGAYEYGITLPDVPGQPDEPDPGVSVEEIAAGGSVNMCVRGHLLTIDSPEGLRRCTIHTPSGATVCRLGDVDRGTTFHDISSMPAGIYIVAWEGGASKIAIR